MPAGRFVFLEGCDVVAETDAAFLLRVPGDGGDTEAWVPRSQMADPDDLKKGDQDVTVGVTEWIAKMKNLPYEES